MKLGSHYLLGALTSCGLICGCGAAREHAPEAPRPLRIVAVERVYADLARQLASPGISVSTILESPDADPHEYEPTARDADAISEADIVVENGLGYDAFIDKLLDASPRDGRVVIDAGDLGGHHTGDNPHVWYETATLQKVISALAAEVSRRIPARAHTVVQRRDALLAWVHRLARQIARTGAGHTGEQVAITEPVFDYVLENAHVGIATPDTFARAIEEGNDPSPQDVETMQALLHDRRVRALVYNDQTIEPSTDRLRTLAIASGVPVVPVSETLPAGLSTQGWIGGEVSALARTL